MIRTLNPSPSADKAAAIMSRFRPIAPKPQPPSNPMNPCPNFPTRTRKRPRPVPVSPPSFKRPATHFSFSGAGTPSSVSDVASETPRERDLLRLLQAPVSGFSVITPQPVRPVRSMIRVGSINESQLAVRLITLPMKFDDVEREVESEVLPAVVSDSNNRVRMANSAYREMVGQPECSWLDSMVAGDRRIGGGVTLQLSDAAVAAVAHSSNGFSCWARIDWRNRDGKKIFITAFCDVVKISCESRDYIFMWRFNTQIRDKNLNYALNSVYINV